MSNDYTITGIEGLVKDFEELYYTPKRALDGLRHIRDVADTIPEDVLEMKRVRLQEIFGALMKRTWEEIFKALGQEGIVCDVPMSDMTKVAIWNSAFEMCDNTTDRLICMYNMARCYQEAPLGRGNAITQFDRESVISNYHKYLEEGVEELKDAPQNLMMYLSIRTGCWVSEEQCQELFDKYCKFVDITTAVELVEEACDTILTGKQYL